MATVNTPRNTHAAGRRADVYGMVLGYESADPWNRTGSTALQPARMRQHQKSAQQSSIGSTVIRIINTLKGL